MRKSEEDIPLQYFERNIMIVIVFLTITAFFGYMTYKSYAEVSPLLFIYGVPLIIFSFMSLWLMLNPYAIIYKDKFEIKKSLISNKFWYFIDIKSVDEISGPGFKIIYNDDDEEMISTFGIKPSHKKKFRDAVNHYVCKSLVVERADD